MTTTSMTTITGQCPMCDHVESLNVPTEAVTAYRAGAYAQDAFWFLTPAEREFFLISGTCGPCWDRLIGFDEEAE